jgi:hypothetical protein
MGAQKPVLSGRSLLFSWLAGAGALPAVILFMVLAQGLGAWFGGARWIGICTPLTRHPWALINQPNLAFSASTAASGYWFGAVLVGLALAVFAPALANRSKADAARFATIQLSWAAAVLAGAWFPLVDLEDGHLTRWLALHDLPIVMVWITPLAAGLAVIPTLLQLLALGREGRTTFGIGARLLTVALFLWAPVFVWVVVVSLLCGAVVMQSCLACLLPIMISATVAARGWGRDRVVEQVFISVRSFLGIVVLSSMMISAVWLCGRPLAGGRVAALLWSTPNAFNNIRDWIEPISPGSESLPSSER